MLWWFYAILVYKNNFLKSRIRETPTLITDVDSKIDTILRGYVIFIFSLFFFIIFCYVKFLGRVGLTDERPRTGHVIRGPMRGLDLIMLSEGQWEALKKIAWEGDKQRNNDNTRTSHLLDQLGPEGRVGENPIKVYKHYHKEHSIYENHKQQKTQNLITVKIY